MPKVSVITTLYNYKNYIEESIKSFISQDFVNSEMIIIDDCSTDNPYEVIKKYKNNRVKYIRLDKKSNYSHAKNVGIKESSSDILVMLDADDFLTPHSIKIRYSKIMEGYDFVHGFALDYKDGRKYPNRLKKEWNRKKSWKYIHAQGVMLKKKIHRKIGLYDEDLWCKSDREFFARVWHHHFKIGTVDDFVVMYRRHKKQMHRSKEKMKVNNKLQKIVLNKINCRKKDLSGLLFLGK